MSQRYMFQFEPFVSVLFGSTDAQTISVLPVPPGLLDRVTVVQCYQVLRICGRFQRNYDTFIKLAEMVALICDDDLRFL